MKRCCGLRVPVGRLRLKDNTEMLLGSWWWCAALADQTGGEYIYIYMFSLVLAKNEMHVCLLMIRCKTTSGGEAAHEAEQQACLMTPYTLIPTVI